MKPTYEQLVQGLRDYSAILHTLEESGLALSADQDEKWAELTVLEQSAS